jgi:chromosome segregation ATPase
MNMPETNSNLAKWLPLALAAAIVIVGAFLYVRIAGVSGEVAALQANLQKETAALRNENAAARDAATKQIEALRAELENARTEAADGARKASGEAKRQASMVAKLVSERQDKHQQEVASELTKMNESARTADARISEVNKDVTGVKGEVTAVKTDVAATRSELQRTVSELKRINGDMGVMSGLIATNGKELAALKELGDRNYISFTVDKNKQPQKVGDIRIVLKKTDPKRNRYNVDLLFDDKKVEKKDKAINEPVQFYSPANARQPHELVVNEVQQNRIVGYLATPKVNAQR